MIMVIFPRMLFEQLNQVLTGALFKLSIVLRKGITL